MRRTRSSSPPSPRSTTVCPRPSPPSATTPSRQAHQLRSHRGRRQDREQRRRARRAAQGQFPIGARVLQVQQQPLPDSEPLHHGSEERREGKSKSRSKGYLDQGLAGPLSPGLPDE